MCISKVVVAMIPRTDQVITKEERCEAVRTPTLAIHPSQKVLRNSHGILHRLARDGYTGYITLEPHVPIEHALTYYQADVSYMHACLKELELAEK